MNNPTVEQIQDRLKFRLVKELNFRDILQFVFENIRIKNAASLSFFTLNFILLTVVVGFCIHYFSDRNLSISGFISALSFGLVAGGFLIIPFHEGFHALAFYFIGARKIRFGADMKQMIFYATAEDFVAGRNGFIFVALAPLLFINLISFMIFPACGTHGQLFILFMLLLHNLMCIGDFAMLSFFCRHLDKELYTFDDLQNRKAFFYERIK